MILMSLDVSVARPVEIDFTGRTAQNKASLWCLNAETIIANNEFDTGLPQVTVTQETLDDFGPNYEIMLPPHSMTVLEWEIQ